MTKVHLGGFFGAVGGATVGDLIKVHGEDFGFAKVKLGEDGEDDLFDFSGEGALRGEEGIFDELLGDGGTALERVLGQVGFEGAGDTLDGEAGVLVKVFVFDGDGGLLEYERDVVESDDRAVFVFEDFIEQGAVPIVDFGGDDGAVGSQAAGAGEVPEDLEVEDDDGGDGDEGEEGEVAATGF